MPSSKPSVSIIFNTCCMDTRARFKRNDFRSALYVERAALLKETLKGLSGFDEVIVAGNFEEGEGYRYVEVPPYFHDRRDALRQREAGARFAKGDLLVFSHDDHAPGENFAYQLRDIANEEWDILVPRRVHFQTKAELNNGKVDGYMGGHLLAMKRWIWAKVPWTSLNTEWWDVSMTRLWREAGAKIVWNDGLIHYDMEASSDEK